MSHETMLWLYAFASATITMLYGSWRARRERQWAAHRCDRIEIDNLMAVSDLTDKLAGEETSPEKRALWRRNLLLFEGAARAAQICSLEIRSTGAAGVDRAKRRASASSGSGPVAGARPKQTQDRH